MAIFYFGTSDSITNIRLTDFFASVAEIYYFNQANQYFNLNWYELLVIKNKFYPLHFAFNTRKLIKRTERYFKCKINYINCMNMPIPGNSTYKKNKYLFLVAIGGFLLRLYQIDFQSIWYDEAFSIFHSNKDLAHILTLNDNTPPLFWILLHFWIKITGLNEISVRILPVIFGTCSVIALYLVAKEILSDDVALFSSLLLSVSPLHIYYSQELRAYSLFCLLCLISMLYFIKLFKNASPKNYLIYILTTLALLYCHMFAVFIVIAQNIYLPLNKPLNFSSYTCSPSTKAQVLPCPSRQLFPIFGSTQQTTK
jgi:hypothetical protein